MSASVNKILFYYLPVIIWLVLIFGISSLSHLPDVRQYWLPLDTIGHFFEYAVLGFLLVRAVYFGNTAPDLKQSVMITMGIALFISAADEFHQLYIPERIASIPDFIADCAGIGMSLIFFRWYVNRSKTRR